jgi:hypothetical protein
MRRATTGVAASATGPGAGGRIGMSDTAAEFVPCVAQGEATKENYQCELSGL